MRIRADPDPKHCTILNYLSLLVFAKTAGGSQNCRRGRGAGEGAGESKRSFGALLQVSGSLINFISNILWLIKG